MQVFDGMFYGGIICSLLFFVVATILFVKNHVGELARDVMGWKRKPIVADVQEFAGCLQKEKVTDVLVREEACAGQFFEVVEDIVVVHTDETIQGRSCL